MDLLKGFKVVRRQDGVLYSARFFLTPARCTYIPQIPCSPQIPNSGLFLFTSFEAALRLAKLYYYYNIEIWESEGTGLLDVKHEVRLAKSFEDFWRAVSEGDPYKCGYLIDPLSIDTVLVKTITLKKRLWIAPKDAI